jgi:DNA-binding ferritin-like protein
MSNSKKCPSNKTKTHIVTTFLGIINTVKLYHWETDVYSIHEATDELKEKLEFNIDRFVEILLGKCRTRINLTQNRIQLIDVKKNDSFKEKLFEYKSFLVDLSIIFNTGTDGDLLSVRDDILGDINQFLYLLSFNH